MSFSDCSASHSSIQSMGSRRRLGAFFILFKTASSSPSTYSSSSSASSSPLQLSLSFLCFFLLLEARLLFVLVAPPLPVFDNRGCCCTVHCASAPSMLFVRVGRLLRPRVLRPLLESTPACISARDQERTSSTHVVSCCSTLLIRQADYSCRAQSPTSAASWPCHCISLPRQDTHVPMAGHCLSYMCAWDCACCAVAIGVLHVREAAVLMRRGGRCIQGHCLPRRGLVSMRCMLCHALGPLSHCVQAVTVVAGIRLHQLLEHLHVAMHIAALLPSQTTVADVVADKGLNWLPFSLAACIAAGHHMHAQRTASAQQGPCHARRLSCRAEDQRSVQ